MKRAIKKWYKKVIMLGIAIIMLAAVNMSVEASEETPMLSEVTIELTDATSGGYKGDIDVIFTDEETGEVHTYTMAEMETYGIGMPGATLLQPDRCYIITYSYPDEELYEIVDIKGGQVENKDFEHLPAGVLFKWKIIDRNEEPAGAEEDSAAEKQNNTDTDSFISVETGNAEADEVFRNFLEKTKVIDGNPEYDYLLNVYESTKDLGSDLYERYTGNSAQEYLNLPTYEKFVIYETYLAVQRTLLEATYSYNFGTEENFLNNYVFHTTGWVAMNGINADVDEAFQEILNWQYHYIIENGCCYNFVTGKSYLEIGGDSKTEEEALRDEAERNAADMQAAYNDLVEAGVDVESLSEEVEEDDSSLGTVIVNIIKDNIISMVLIVVILIALGAIAIWKKKYNYTNGDSEENK